MSGITVSPDDDRGGAQNATEGKGPAATPSRSQTVAASGSKKRLGRSSQSRSSPFTLKTRMRRLAAPSPRMSGRPLSSLRKNSAKDVLVATPEIPEMDMCPPFLPSKKSRSTYTGSPSRPSPMGRARSIWSR